MRLLLYLVALAHVARGEQESYNVVHHKPWVIRAITRLFQFNEIHTDRLPSLLGVDGAKMTEALDGATMRMTEKEGRMWFSQLLAARRYLEYGSGGSTVVAAWRAMQPSLPSMTIHSVESSQEWVDQLRADNPIIRAAEAAGKLTFRIRTLGETGAWGAPLNWSNRSIEERRAVGRAYCEAFYQCRYDVILIDGRFRGACAIHAVKLLDKHTVVFVHDYTLEGRPYKETMASLYGVLQMQDTLAMFRHKRNSTKGLYLKALTDPT